MLHKKGKNTGLKIRVLLAALCCSFSGNAQIKVENDTTAEFYVKNVLLGPGITVANIKHLGMIGGLGQFEADATILGVKSGLILSTGNVDSIHGPNNKSYCTTVGKLPDNVKLQKKMAKGDTDLNKLCRMKTTDITVIEFDFVPVRNVIEFNYVFASEEYPEWAGSPFNDVFGFFLSGPGIRKKVNLAVLPDGKTPVAINTVNKKTNKKYFRRNTKNVGVVKTLFTKKQKIVSMRELNKHLQFDGITTVLTVHYDVIPYKKYHMKIALGDASDCAYDTGVFLEAGSFISIADSSGKYFKKLEAYARKTPNVDSILNIKHPVDSVIPPVIDEKFEVTDIYFDVASSQLNDSSKAQLRELSEYLKKHPGFNCTLYGYTDNTGSKKLNEELSEQRAKAVEEFLEKCSVSKNRLRYESFGYANPRASNETNAGRALNRRVEIIIED